MEISKEIIENIFLDWKKKDIPKQVRAELLKAYREKYKLTQRKFEEVTGISKGTLHDWENPEVRDNRYNNEEKKLKSVYQTLSNIKDLELNEEKYINKIEIEINRLREIIRIKFINK